MAMSTKPLFQGSAVALITPFRNGRVDMDALDRLVELQIAGGTAAIVACGTTGEPATLTQDEREQVIGEIVKVAHGRVPVVCGTGSNCTQTVIDTEKRYRDMGCAAQLVVTPYYNKTTQEGLYAHFMAIADNTQLPIIVYNVPSRTNLDISPKTLERLCASERFIAVKESSYNIPFVMEKIAAVGDRLTFYSGNDDLVYTMLTLGAKGVISVAANLFPSKVAQVTEKWFAGDVEQSLRCQLELLPLCRALFCEVSPIPVKFAAETLGLCASEVRLPLVQASDEAKQKMLDALRGLNA